MNYWHNFRQGKKKLEATRDKPTATVKPAEATPTPEEAAQPAEHPDSIDVSGTPVVPFPSAKPRTFEEKAFLLNEFNIDSEAVKLAEFVTYLLSNQVYLSAPQQRNLYLHFSEVLRRCAYVHLYLTPEQLKEND